MKSMLELSKPTLDSVVLENAEGVPATRASWDEDFHRQFEAALAEKGPRLIKCQVPIPSEFHALREYTQRTR
jgi:acetolactate synthase I/II/III large subunit